MSPAVREALADLDSAALSAEEAGHGLLAHIIQRSVRTVRAELAPKVAGQEDDGDPEVPGERIDPTVFDKCAQVYAGLTCTLAAGHEGLHYCYGWRWFR